MKPQEVLIHHSAAIILPDVKEPDVKLICHSSKNTTLMKMSSIMIDGAFKAVDFQIFTGKLRTELNSRGPRTSSVNCFWSCRCAFYRHIPLLDCSGFTTNFVNSVLGQSLLSVALK